MLPTRRNVQIGRTVVGRLTAEGGERGAALRAEQRSQVDLEQAAPTHGSAMLWAYCGIRSAASPPSKPAAAHRTRVRMSAPQA